MHGRSPSVEVAYELEATIWNTRGKGEKENLNSDLRRKIKNTIATAMGQCEIYEEETGGIASPVAPRRGC